MPYVKNITSFASGRSVERSKFVFKNPNEVADFCLNKCPHPDETCHGTCPEYKNFIKELKGVN